MKKHPLSVIREDIKSLSGYHVQDASNMIKLDAMENPFSLPKEIYQQWIERLSEISINRYPNPKASGVELRLRTHLSLDESYGVLFGNGSDELIQILMTALAKPGAKVLTVEPGFVMYRMIAQFCGLEYSAVDLSEDFSLDFKALKNAIIEHQPELIFLAQPNNPTGNLFDEQQLIELIELSEGLFVLDEAYTDFTDFDGLKLLERYENLLVMRTFSKTGLAGLRLGYMVGAQEIIRELNKIRLPYNINVLTQGLAEVVLENFDFLKVQTEKIRSLREALSTELKAISYIEVLPSEANFVTVRLLFCHVPEVANKLKEQGVLIKVLHGSHPLLENCLRLTVGNEYENEILIKALKKIVI